MRQMCKALGLLLLLMVAQQGAVVHELSHVAGASSGEWGAQPDSTAGKTCVLCPTFAQVVTPAVSHAFHIPLLVRFTQEAVAASPIAAIDAAVPCPRSRGPPSLS
jgi:hypothetical protein